MNKIHTLVIACGNSLRGDDGVGTAAAELVRSWQAPGVKVLAVHQLVPELIDEMRQVDRVLFIDAAMNAGDGAFTHCTIEPRKSRRFFGHHETPANLLALLGELHGRTPNAWLVSISALSLDHGEGLTDGAQHHLHAALAWIRSFVVEGFVT